jgi:hypothetical protein
VIITDYPANETCDEDIAAIDKKRGITAQEQ